MPLDMEVGLSPGDIVLDGDPAAPPGNEHSTPPLSRFADACKRAYVNFGSRLLWRNGCVDQDAIWYGGRLGPETLCWIGTHVPSRKGQHLLHFCTANFFSVLITTFSDTRAASNFGGSKLLYQTTTNGVSRDHL